MHLKELSQKSKSALSKRHSPRFCLDCWFSHDVTKIHTSELLILLRFYFHAV